MYCRSPKELALFVANKRKELDLSQTAICERTGLNQKTISAFENQPENTKLATLFQILSAVNLDLEITPKNQVGEPKERWSEEW